MIGLQLESLKNHTYTAIGERLNYNSSAIALICKCDGKCEHMESYYGGGCKLKFNRAKAWNLNFFVRRKIEARRLPLSVITNSMNGLRVDGPITPSIARRELKKLNLASCIVSNKPFLNSRQQELRLV